MLTSILNILARKESISMTRLALEVGCSLKELESALEQMKHMGYIRNELFGQACGTACGSDRDSSRCEGCGFASSETFIAWVLTERGQTIAGSIRR